MPFMTLSNAPRQEAHAFVAVSELLMPAISLRELFAGPGAMRCQHAISHLANGERAPPDVRRQPLLERAAAVVSVSSTPTTGTCQKQVVAAKTNKHERLMNEFSAAAFSTSAAAGPHRSVHTKSVMLCYEWQHSSGAAGPPP